MASPRAYPQCTLETAFKWEVWAKPTLSTSRVLMSQTKWVGQRDAHPALDGPLGRVQGRWWKGPQLLTQTPPPSTSPSPCLPFLLLRMSSLADHELLKGRGLASWVTGVHFWLSCLSPVSHIRTQEASSSLAHIVLKVPRGLSGNSQRWCFSPPPTLSSSVRITVTAVQAPRPPLPVLHPLPFSLTWKPACPTPSLAR